jgi:hypothetical protein
MGWLSITFGNQTQTGLKGRGVASVSTLDDKGVTFFSVIAASRCVSAGNMTDLNQQYTVYQPQQSPF